MDLSQSEIARGIANHVGNMAQSVGNNMAQNLRDVKQDPEFDLIVLSTLALFSLGAILLGKRCLKTMLFCAGATLGVTIAGVVVHRDYGGGWTLVAAIVLALILGATLCVLYEFVIYLAGFVGGCYAGVFLATLLKQALLKVLTFEEGEQAKLASELFCHSDMRIFIPVLIVLIVCIAVGIWVAKFIEEEAVPYVMGFAGSFSFAWSVPAVLAAIVKLMEIGEPMNAWFLSNQDSLFTLRTNWRGLVEKSFFELLGLQKLAVSLFVVLLVLGVFLTLFINCDSDESDSSSRKRSTKAESQPLVQHGYRAPQPHIQHSYV